MDFIELLLIAVGLSMDAFAVSICKGLAAGQTSIRQMGIAGAWFGGFQALMPLLGYLLGFAFQNYIVAFDHWIAFVLLGCIGANMIKSAFSKSEDDSNASFDYKNMLLLAIATSIDALAVGITFAFLKVNILQAITIVGITTFIFSAAGIKIGSIFGSRYKSKAEIAGGIILIFMGSKILMEHTGILNYVFI